MKQFEIWWADLPQPAGHRPVFLLSRDDSYSYLNKFVIAEINFQDDPFVSYHGLRSIL